MLLVLMQLIRLYTDKTRFNLICRPSSCVKHCPDGIRINAFYRLAESGPLAARLLNSLLASVSNPIVFGGGSIFHSLNSISWKLSIAKAAERLNKSVGAVGVSFGPFPTLEAEALCRKLVRKMEFICVRDRQSYDFVQECNTSALVACSTDLGLLAPTYISGINLSGHREEGRVLGVTLRAMSRSSGDYLLRIAKAITALRTERGFNEIRLIDFCADPLRGDDSIHEKLRRQLGLDLKVTHFRYDGDPLRTLQMVSECSAYVGMRLHSQLFSLLAGVPFVAIPYHRKSTDILGDIGLSSHVLPIEQVCVESVEEILSRAENTPLFFAKLLREVIVAANLTLAEFGSRLRDKNCR